MEVAPVDKVCLLATGRDAEHFPPSAPGLHGSIRRRHQRNHHGGRAGRRQVRDGRDVRPEVHVVFDGVVAIKMPRHASISIFKIQGPPLGARFRRVELAPLLCKSKMSSAARSDDG